MEVGRLYSKLLSLRCLGVAVNTAVEIDNTRKGVGWVLPLVILRVLVLAALHALPL